MSNTAAPEVVIIGDSHAIALKQGCESLGIPAGLLAVSGNFWHSGEVRFDPAFGIRMRGNRPLAAAGRRLSESLGGGPVLRAGLPVIVSAGFQLGRLVPKLRGGRHVADAGDFAADPAALFVSGAFLDRYLAHQRDPQIAILRDLARAAPVTVVPPPRRGDTGTHGAVFDLLCRRIRAAGLDLYDPFPDLGASGGGLDPACMTPDLSHGNARYGRAVIELLLARGSLARKAA